MISIFFSFAAIAAAVVNERLWGCDGHCDVKAKVGDV